MTLTMLHKCYTVSRSLIGETNGSISKSWIAFPRRIVSELTSAAEFLTHRQNVLNKTSQDTIKEAVHKVRHARGRRGSEKVLLFVTGGGGQDPVTSRLYFF